MEDHSVHNDSEEEDGPAEQEMVVAQYNNRDDIALKLSDFVTPTDGNSRFILLRGLALETMLPLPCEDRTTNFIYIRSAVRAVNLRLGGLYRDSM